MANTEYLTLADVIAIHELVMRSMGLLPNPLRADGTLESAVMRPQMAAWYEGADIVRQAALLGIGISQAQAFLDGNKRTAYMAMVTFLRLNGFAYTGDRLELAQQFEAFAVSSRDDQAIDTFEAWLRSSVAPRAPAGNG